jgi:hypothetical protein
MDGEVRKGRKLQRQMVTSLQIITAKIMVVDFSKIQLVIGM